MKIKTLVIYIASLALLSAVLAQGSPKEDLPTPMAAARSYFTAMKAGDTNIFQRAALGTVYQKDWMAAYVRCGVAVFVEVFGEATFRAREADEVIDFIRLRFDYLCPRSSAMVAKAIDKSDL